MPGLVDAALPAVYQNEGSFWVELEFLGPRTRTPLLSLNSAVLDGSASKIFGLKLKHPGTALWVLADPDEGLFVQVRSSVA